MTMKFLSKVIVECVSSNDSYAVASCWLPCLSSVNSIKHERSESNLLTFLGALKTYNHGENIKVVKNDGVKSEGLL